MGNMQAVPASGFEKSTPFAAQIAAEKAGQKATAFGLKARRFSLKDQDLEGTLQSEHLIMQVIKLQILKTSHHYHTMGVDHQKREEFNG